MNFVAAIVYVIARLKEPSSYAGLGGFLVAAHVANPGAMSAQVTTVGVAIATILAVLMPEKK